MNHPDSAGLAATAGQNLALENSAAAESGDRRRRLLRRIDQSAGRNGDAVLLEKLTGLVLV